MHRKFWFTLCFIVLAGRSPLLAQTATLSGTVVDASGAAIPSAQASIANTETGIQRMAQTDVRGRFAVPQLPPGSYQLTVTREGFETLVRNGITLTVGQEAVLNLTLTVGAVTEQVTVTGEAPLLNTTSSAVAGVVEEQRIQELPLNGRDFSQLPLVQPGVTAVRNGDTAVSTTKGYGARVSMGGSRADQTAWMLDGTNIHSPSNFGTPGSAAGVMLGVDAMREFQVLTSNYSAEYGGTSGGVVNMVSKSGTNGYHGSLIETIRSSHLDASKWEDNQSPFGKPVYKRNQFGGSLGGAIKKDRTFFFGNYEGLRQRQGVSNQPTVPDAGAHTGLGPAQSGGGLQQYTVAPEMRPYLDMWPLPNGPAVGVNTATATLYSVVNSAVGEDFFVTRVDHHISDKQSIFSRFTFDQGKLTSPDTLHIANSLFKGHTRFATLQHDYIVSGALLLTSRVAYNRTLTFSTHIPLIDIPPNLGVYGPGLLPGVGFTGVTGLGLGTTQSLRVQNLTDYQENLQYIHGSHSMKFGGEFTHVGSNKTGEAAGLDWGLSWATMPDFLLDNKMQSFSGAVSGSDTTRSYMQYIYGAYFQDDWKLRPSLTLNLGLRYEPFTSPTEKFGRVSMVDDWVHATTFDTTIGLFKNPSKKNFSPRVGFAWDVKGDGKTALRGGFGLFFVDLLGPYYETPGQKNPPYFSSTANVLGDGKLSSVISEVSKISAALLSTTMTPATFMELIQWKVNPSYEMKVNLTVQRQLPGNLSLAIGYLGGRGFHLWRNADVNDSPFTIVNGREFVAAGIPRLNPNTGVGTTRYSDVQSFYNGLQMELKKNFSHGFQFQTAFTWSKNIDDSTTGVANTDYNEGVSSQEYNTKVDRGLSALHVGKNLVMNGVYQIPSPFSSGVASSVLGGWQLSSILTVSSGTPFSVKISGRNAPDQSRSAGGQRPDLVDGRSGANLASGTTAGCTFVNGIPGPVDSSPAAASQTVLPGQKLGTPDLYYDPCGFALPTVGFYGIAGRNIITGPGLVNADINLVKNIPLGLREGMHLEFRGELYNLFNRPNFAVPSSLSVVNRPTSGVLATNGLYVGGAGRITKTISASRQMSFGLKLVF